MRLCEALCELTQMAGSSAASPWFSTGSVSTSGLTLIVRFACWDALLFVYAFSMWFSFGEVALKSVPHCRWSKAALSFEGSSAENTSPDSSSSTTREMCVPSSLNDRWTNSGWIEVDLLFAFNWRAAELLSFAVFISETNFVRHGALSHTPLASGLTQAAISTPSTVVEDRVATPSMATSWSWKIRVFASSLSISVSNCHTPANSSARYSVSVLAFIAQLLMPGPVAKSLSDKKRPL